MAFVKPHTDLRELLDKASVVGSLIAARYTKSTMVVFSPQFSLQKRVIALVTVGNLLVFFISLCLSVVAFVLLKQWNLFSSVIVAADAGLVLDLFFGTLSDLYHGSGLAALAAILVGLVLFSFNVALVIAYMRALKRAFYFGSHVGVNLVGMIGLLLGLQCLSCVTVIGLLSASFVGVGFLSALPFEGKEFLILGLGVLAISSLKLAKVATDPIVC